MALTIALVALCLVIAAFLVRGIFHEADEYEKLQKEQETEEDTSSSSDVWAGFTEARRNYEASLDSQNCKISCIGSF